MPIPTTDIVRLLDTAASNYRGAMEEFQADLAAGRDTSATGSYNRQHLAINALATPLDELITLIMSGGEGILGGVYVLHEVRRDTLEFSAFYLAHELGQARPRATRGPVG